MLRNSIIHPTLWIRDHGRLPVPTGPSRCGAVLTRRSSESSHVTPASYIRYDCILIARPNMRARVAPAATSASSPPVESDVVEIPGTQQEAVESAVKCLVPALQTHLASLKLAKTSKGFSNSSKGGRASNRYGVEIPVLDGSAQAASDLASLVIKTIAAQVKQRGGVSGAAAVAPSNWTVAHARVDALEVARSRGGNNGAQLLGLRQACQQPQLGGMLLIVEPSVADVALVEQLLDEVWVGPAAVVLNPQWAQQGVVLPPEYQPVAESISVIYSFLPCAIQGLLGPKEGAVLRTVEAGATSAKGAPWRILLKEREQFVQVGAMARRPTSSDLELAFINAAAASSPLTKTAKFIRGLIPGKKA